ncbi:hypothetical protein DFS33DRAFT_1384612 [Desarmillaria ectypa]|nr:hypothetical protein DFS33DRAFT_1384612 [Desarmillaria ectypa]
MLGDAVKKDVIPRTYIESSLDQIKQGTEHIHGLSLNDINTCKVMLNADETLVIIDFDSCLGQKKFIDGKSSPFPFSNSSETAGLSIISMLMEEEQSGAE